MVAVIKNIEGSFKMERYAYRYADGKEPVLKVLEIEEREYVL